MAGTATISTIKHDVTGAATTFRDGSGNEIGRLSKSQLNYDGVNFTIRASFNVSSVTNNTTGDNTETFSIAFADNSYTAIVSEFKNAYYSTVVSQYYNAAYSTGRTTSTYRTYYAATSSLTAQNPDALDILIFR